MRLIRYLKKEKLCVICERYVKDYKKPYLCSQYCLDEYKYKKSKL